MTSTTTNHLTILKVGTTQPHSLILVSIIQYNIFNQLSIYFISLQ